MDAPTLAFLARLVGPVAWAAYEELDPLDLSGLLEDAGGDARHVAAEVLEYAAHAEQGAQAAQVKAFKVVGEYEEEYFAPAKSAAQSRAEAWLARAASLRSLARGSGAAHLTLDLVGW